MQWLFVHYEQGLFFGTKRNRLVICVLHAVLLEQGIFFVCALHAVLLERGILKDLLVCALRAVVLW